MSRAAFMVSMSPAWLFGFGFALVVAGCAGAPVVEGESTVGRGVVEAPSGGEAAAPVRPVVFVGSGGELFAVVPGGSAPRSLGQFVSDNGGGNVDQGSAAPVQSWDGRWVAYLHDGDLYVVQVADGALTRVTRFYPEAPELANIVWILIAGWTPDSGQLLFHQTEPSFEEDDPAPLPAGAQYGFHMLTVEGMGVTPVVGLPAFTAWAANDAVLHNRYLDGGGHALMRYPLDGGEGESLRTTTDGYGYTQLNVVGGDGTWMEGRRVVRATLVGGATTPLGPEAPFASQQWPRLSPDGKHVAFLWSTDDGVVIGLTRDAATAPEVLEPCQGQCAFYWYSADALAVSDGAGVRLVALGGERTPLAPSGEIVPVGVR